MPWSLGHTRTTVLQEDIRGVNIGGFAGVSPEKAATAKTGGSPARGNSGQMTGPTPGATVRFVDFRVVPLVEGEEDDEDTDSDG